MTGLYTYDGTLITPYVSVIPRKETIKIENRLLDGSFHIQTIGTSADVLQVTLQVASEAGRARIDLMEATGEELRIIVGTEEWYGLIRNALQWEKRAGIFKTTFDLLVIVET